MKCLLPGLLYCLQLICLAQIYPDKSTLHSGSELGIPLEKSTNLQSLLVSFKLVYWNMIMSDKQFSDTFPKRRRHTSGMCLFKNVCLRIHNISKNHNKHTSQLVRKEAKKHFCILFVCWSSRTSSMDFPVDSFVIPPEFPFDIPTRISLGIV